MTATVNRDIMRYSTTDNVANAMSIDGSTGSVTVSVSTDEGGDGVIDGKGEAYLWIGGSISAAPTQQRGAYMGTFGVLANYAN